MIGGALFFDGDNDFGEVAHDEAFESFNRASGFSVAPSRSLQRRLSF